MVTKLIEFDFDLPYILVSLLLDRYGIQLTDHICDFCRTQCNDMYRLFFRNQFYICMNMSPTQEGELKSLDFDTKTFVGYK